MKLGAGGQYRTGQQKSRGGNFRKPAPGRLPDKAEACEDHDNGHDDGAENEGQVLPAGQGLKGQLEHQGGHHAEVHIVPAVVESHVPQGAGGLGTAGTVVVGVVHLQQRLRGILHQIQPSVQEGMSQHAGLIQEGAVGTGKGDRGAAVPLGGIVLLGGHAGIMRGGKGADAGQQTEKEDEPGHTGAQALLGVKVAEPPQHPAGGPKHPSDAQHGKQHGKAYRRKFQRSGRVGRDAAERPDKTVPLALAEVVALQGQGRDAARKIQRQPPGARSLGGIPPSPAGDFAGVGLVGGGDGKLQTGVGIGIVSGGVEIGGLVDLQIVDGLIHAGKMQRGGTRLNDNAVGGAGLARIGDQVVEQLERLVPVGGKIVDVADKDFPAQGRQQKQRQQGGPVQAAPGKGQQPEPADADRQPARRPAEDDEPESVKPHRQARLGKEADPPQPDGGKHSDAGQTLPAGDPAPEHPGGHCGKEQTDQSRQCQCGSKHHSAQNPFLRAKSRITARTGSGG